jgi:hypothetical protein
MSDDDEEGARVIPFRGGGDPDYVPPPIPAYADEPAPPSGDFPEPPAFPEIPPRPLVPPVIPLIPPLPDPEAALYSSGIPARPGNGGEPGEFEDESGEEFAGEYHGSLADRFAEWIDYRVAVGQARLEEEKPYREAKIAAKAAKLQARAESQVARMQANTKLRQAYGKGRSDLAAARSTGADRAAGRSGGGGVGGRRPLGGRPSGGGAGGNRGGVGGGSGRSPSSGSGGATPSGRGGGGGRGPSSRTGAGGSKSGSGAGGRSPGSGGTSNGSGRPGGMSGGSGRSGGTSGGSGKFGGSSSSNGTKGTRASGAGGKSGVSGPSSGGSPGASGGSGTKTRSGGKSGSGHGSSGSGRSGSGAGPIRHTTRGPGRPSGGLGAGSGTGVPAGGGKGRHSGSGGSGSRGGPLETGGPTPATAGTKSGGGRRPGSRGGASGPGRSGRDKPGGAGDRGRRVVRHRLKNGKKKSGVPWDRKVLTPEEEAAPAWDRHHAGCPVDYDAADYAQLAIERGDYEEAKKIINASACPVRTADEALRMLGSPEARWVREHAKKAPTRGEEAGERPGTTTAGIGASRPADDSRERGSARRFFSWLRGRASGRRPEDAPAAAKAPPVPADTVGWHTEAVTDSPARTAYAPPLPEPLALEASAGPLPSPPPATGPSGGESAAEPDDQDDDLPVVPLAFPPPRAPRPAPTTDEENSMAKEVATAQTGLAAQHRTDITFDEYLVVMAQAAACCQGYRSAIAEAAPKLAKIADAVQEMADDLAGDHNIAAAVTVKLTELAEAAARMKRQAGRTADSLETTFETARQTATRVATVYGEDMAEVEDKGLASASAAAHHE